MSAIACFLGSQLSEILKYGPRRNTLEKGQRAQIIQELHRIAATARSVHAEVTSIIMERCRCAVRGRIAQGVDMWGLSPMCASCGTEIYGIPCLQFGCVHYGCLERGALRVTWLPAAWTSWYSQMGLPLGGSETSDSDS